MNTRSRFSNYFWPILSTLSIISAVVLDKASADNGAKTQEMGTESSKSQDKSAASKFDKVVLGVAKMSEISNKSIFFKEVNKKITKMQKAIQGKVQVFQKEIAKKVKSLQSLSKSGVNQKTMKEKQAELQKEIAEKERLIQAEQTNIQNFQQGQMMEIFRQVKLIFKSLGEKYGLTTIVDSESTLYYSKDQTVDVTEEALIMLNSVKNEDSKESIRPPKAD